MNISTKRMLISVFAGAVAGLIVSLFVLGISLQDEKTSEEKIKEFYDIETAVMVSPHHLRKHLNDENKDFILVDVRSEEEYLKEHIKGAINIPVYKNKYESDYGAVERLVNEFSKLGNDKDVIVYCYSGPCMSGRKVGKVLADNEIYVKHLGVGWNEWRYYWEIWNHEHEWAETNVEDYIESGVASESSLGEAYVGSGGCAVDGILGC